MKRGVDILPGEKAGYQTVREPGSKPAQDFGPEPSEYGGWPKRTPATGMAAGPYDGAAHYRGVHNNNALYAAIRSHEASIRGAQVAPGRAPRFAAEAKLQTGQRGSSGRGL
jgi:hypothetical protein